MSEENIKIDAIAPSLSFGQASGKITMDEKMKKVDPSQSVKVGGGGILKQIAGMGTPLQEKAKWDQIFQQVSNDPVHRENFKSSAMTFLTQAGITVPEGVEITVLEFDPKHMYFMLPPTFSGQDDKKG